MMTSIQASVRVSALAAAIVGAAATTAAAEDAKVDKSQFSLFNRTPDSALRDFAADRPAKSYGPTTVDAGRVQLELETFNYTNQKIDGIRTQTYVGPNPTARIGLTQNVELQLNMAPYVYQSVRDSGAMTTTNASGPSDFFARAKINLWGNEGGRTAVALIPYIKAGTAPESLGGNRATEGGIIAASSFNLPNNVSLTFNAELDHLKNNADSNYHSQLVGTAGITMPVIKDVALTLELWSQTNYDPAKTVRQYSFDTALAWTVQPNLQLDIGANFGLNKDTPGFQIYTGLARRF